MQKLETGVSPDSALSAPFSRKASNLRGRNFFPFSLLWFCIIALEISVFAKIRISESDIWFHLRNAQELLNTHTFLKADLYTFTSSGTPLVNFEWLAELPYYFAFRWLGQSGLLAVYLVILWLIFGGVYYLALRRGANCADAAIVTAVGVVLGSYSSGPRMLQFGWLCLTALLLVLERFQRIGKGLWVLPPLFALWINFHGSWVFGLIVLGIYIVSGLVQGRWSTVVAERWTPTELRKLIAASLASVAALFVNPYGYKLVWYPFDLLFRQTAVRRDIIEWQSVDFHTAYGALAMLMVLSLLAAAWFSREPWELMDVLLVAFALWTSLTHVRFLLFAAIILVPILAPRLQLFTPYDSRKDKPWLNLALATVVVIVMFNVYPSAAEIQAIINGDFPHDALYFMRQKHINGRLFHFYDFGGYIEWNAPAIKTFADGRADIFTYNGVMDDYLRINNIEQPFELLDKYKIDYVLFPVGKRLSYVLDHSAGWRLIYQDKVVKLYERAPAAGNP
jgi:hypothetical protein